MSKLAIEVMRLRQYRKRGWNETVDVLADIYATEKEEGIMDLLMSAYEAGRLAGIRARRVYEKQ